MEKNDLVGDALKIMPPEYVPLLYQGKLLRNDTSGSTGKCLEVYWKREDYMRSMFSLWFYRKKFYGIQPWHKRCRFYTMAEPGEKEPLSRVEENALTFSKNNLTEQRMVEIYCEMLELVMWEDWRKIHVIVDTRGKFCIWNQAERQPGYSWKMAVVSHPMFL